MADGDAPVPLWPGEWGAPSWDLRHGEEVWGLHLAFLRAAEDDPSLYSPPPHEVAFIGDLAQHREELLAFEAVLTHATASPSPELLDQTLRVARLLIGDGADDYARAWLDWQPDSGKPPPYRT